MTKQKLWSFFKKYWHFLLLLVWLPKMFAFRALEAGIVTDYHVMYSVIDDYIPFISAFVIPYYIWYVLLYGTPALLGFVDVPAYKRHIVFTVITYTIAFIFYAIFPNGQDLREARLQLTDGATLSTLQYNNFCERMIAYIYSIDTNTNVCPSLHVVGSFAVAFSFFDSPKLKAWWLRLIIVVLCTLAAISTVFIGQHSIVDVFWGIILSLAIYPVTFIWMKKVQEKNAAKKLEIPISN